MEIHHPNPKRAARRLALRVQEWLGIFSLSRLVRWLIYLFAGMWLYQNWHEDLPLADLTEHYSFPDSKFTEIDGMRVHYRRVGKGEPLLLLHDAGSSLHTWTTWVEKFSPDYQVIAVDLPGFGLTGPHPRGSYSAFMYAGFLEKFVDSLGLKTFHLAGNGLGAQMAWFFAAEHPERLRKLMLLNAPGFEKKTANWVTLIARTPLINKVFHKITPERFIKLRLEALFADDRLVSDSLVQRHFDLFLRPGARKAFTDRAQVAENNPPVEDFLGKISCPTLILWGAEDTEISPENAYQFHKKIRTSDLKIYQNTGHWPQEENAEQSAADARAFLEGKF